MTQTLIIDSGSLVVDDLPPPWSSTQSVRAGVPSFGETVGTVSRDSVWTVASVVSSTIASGFVQLSSGFQVGDLVEIVHGGGDRADQVILPPGEVRTDNGSSLAVVPNFLRKLSSSTWGVHA